MGLSKFISKEDQEKIVDAISDAEELTSGEIRVHIEPICKNEDPCERALQVFYEIGMHNTEARNGVVIYIAFKSRKLAIIADKGINDVVPANFWDEEKDILRDYLKNNKPSEGLCKVIGIIGENLKKYFPCQPDDINEQSNDISYSE